MHLVMGAVSLWMDTAPGPVPVYRPLKIPTSTHGLHATIFLTGATVEAQLCSPRRHLWNSRQKDIDHLIQEQLRNLHGQRDHGGQPLRRDRDDDDLWNSQGMHNRGIHLDLCNLHDKHNMDIGHRVNEQLGNRDGPTNSPDHGTSLSATTGKSARPANQGHRPPCTGATGELRWSAEWSRPWESAFAPRQGNLHDLQTRGIDHHVQEQLGNYDGLLNGQDHGNRPLHHDRETATTEIRSFLHGATYRSFWSMLAMMTSILGLKTTGRNTARGAIPAKPATQLSLWSVLAMMRSTPGLPTTKGTLREQHRKQQTSHANDEHGNEHTRAPDNEERERNPCQQRRIRTPREERREEDLGAFFFLLFFFFLLHDEAPGGRCHKDRREHRCQLKGRPKALCDSIQPVGSSSSSNRSSSSSSCCVNGSSAESKSSRSDSGWLRTPHFFNIGQKCEKNL